MKVKLILASIFMLAFAIRLFACLADETLPVKDAAEYDQLAMSLAEGKGYRNPGGELTAWRPPLYPLFLAGIYRAAGHDYRAVRIAQAFLSTLTVVIIAAWAGLVFGRDASAWAALIAAVYPPFYAHYYSCSALLTETLYTFLLISALFLLFWYLDAPSQTKAASSGVFWGLSVLTRSVPLALFAFLPFGLFFLGYSIRRIAGYFFAAGALVFVVLAPWMIRNYRVFGSLVPVSTNGGLTFYEANHPGSDGFGNEFRKAVISPQDEHLKLQGLNEVERSRYFFKKGIEFVRMNPGEAAGLFMRKMALYLDPTETIDDGNVRKRLINFGYVLIAFGSAAGLLIGAKDEAHRRQVFSLSFIFIFFILLHGIFPASHRYRYPSEPILILITAYAMQFAQRLRVKPRNHAGLLGKTQA